MIPTGEGRLTASESMGVIAIKFAYLEEVQRGPGYDTVRTSSVPLQVSEQTLKGQTLTHRAGYVYSRLTGYMLMLS